jgi:hypothetical protein
MNWISTSSLFVPCLKNHVVKETALSVLPNEQRCELKVLFGILGLLLLRVLQSHKPLLCQQIIVIYRLLDNGFTIMDIANATLAVEDVQKQRLETFRNMKRDEVGLIVAAVAKWMFAPKDNTTAVMNNHEVTSIMLSPKSMKKRSVSARTA